MPFRTGTANGYIHLLALLRSYVRGWARESARTFSGTGNGTLTRVVFLTTQAQTWTITFTSATAATVVGSVTGSAGTATVGTFFDTANVQLLLTAGTTPFVAGDVFTVTASANGLAAGDLWVQERWTLDYTGATPSELILRGPGAGTDQIMVGMQTVFNVTGNYHNWKLGGFTGFNSALPFASQPGYFGDSPHPMHLTLWPGDIPFWLVVNGRRILLVAKVSTAFCGMHLGFLRTFATPGQWPYPLLIGGNLSFGGVGTTPDVTSSQWAWNGGLAENFYQEALTGAADPNTQNRSGCRLRLPNGTWRDFWASVNGQIGDVFSSGDFTNNSAVDWDTSPQRFRRGAGVWPWCQSVNGMDQNLDGSVPLFPATLLAGGLVTDAADLLGEVDGLFWVPSPGLAAEDVVQQGGVDHLVINNVQNATAGALAAVALA